MAGNGFECPHGTCDPRQITQQKGSPCPKCGTSRDFPVSEHPTVPPGPDMWYPLPGGGKYYLDEQKRKYTKGPNGEHHLLRRRRALGWFA